MKTLLSASVGTVCHQHELEACTVCVETVLCAAAGTSSPRRGLEACNAVLLLHYSLEKGRLIMSFHFIAFPIKLATTAFAGFLCDIHACSCFLGATTKSF